jgi:hypothetical protein
MPEKFPQSISELAEYRQQTQGEPNICIAIIDGRVDPSHPCLIGGQLQEIIPASWRLATRPCQGTRGTHVASIAFDKPDELVDGIALSCRGIIIPVDDDETADRDPHAHSTGMSLACRMRGAA